MNSFNLPLAIGEQLRLRWATAADRPALAEFNALIHEEGAEQAGIIRHWVEDLMGGQHPTAESGDFTLVEEVETGRIVSSLCTIPQTWRYEEIEFPVGRPELVGTLAEYRQQGLVRLQMEAIHAKGAARGELMQGITGIPWYYRQFGYEMALDLGGGRTYLWDRPGNLVHLSDEEETYTWRIARASDIPLLKQLYERHCANNLLSSVRTEEIWRHDLAGHQEGSVQARHFWMITHKTAGDVGYVQFAIWEPALVIHEVAVVGGHSLRAVALYLTRMFKGLAKMRVEKEKKKAITHLFFRMADNHPLMAALGRQLEQYQRPYAWYIRIADVPAFLRRIQPVLERRLSQSVMAGHTGNLRLNLYRGGTLQLRFEQGILTEVGSYTKQEMADGDAHFPDLLLIQLLCGRHSLAELTAVQADCFGTAEAEILLGILFPKQASLVWGVG
jgi:predicted acetyltransferase